MTEQWMGKRRQAIKKTFKNKLHNLLEKRLKTKTLALDQTVTKHSRKIEYLYKMVNFEIHKL